MKKLIPLILLFAGLASAQVTYNQPVTWAGSTTTSTAARSDVVRNVGQASHFFYVCASASVTYASVEIDGSFDGTTWEPISGNAYPKAGDCEFITGGGYFPQIALNVTSLLGTSPAISANYSASSSLLPLAVTTPANVGDACQDPSVPKSSLALSLSGAGTTSLLPIALTNPTIMDVCSLSFTITGTSPTLAIESGTGSTCGTGTTVLTGTMAPAADSFLQLSGAGATLFLANSGTTQAHICAVLGGTTPSLQGVMVYVQQ